MKNQLKKLKLPDEICKKLGSFTKCLMDWNKIHNLTGAKTYKTIEEQIYDSIYPLTFLPKQDSLLDIGTGAGFPGLMLSIVMPDTKCTLCEPLHKRASFLKFIVRELQIENVTVEVGRVEEIKIKPYDLITSRAVTDTKTLIKWSYPFVGKNTQMLFYKGKRVFEEIKELETCKYELISQNRRNYLWIKQLPL